MSASHAYRITDHIKNLIKGRGQNDPIVKQYIPSESENHISPEELTDPIGDDAHSPVKGIVHRYPDRVLLKISSVCAVYCRYCFRKDMIGPDSDGLSKEDIKAALDYIRETPDIWEVILTGGDPLVLSARRLKDLLDALEKIDHVKVLRIHSRIPVADPARITPELCTALKRQKAVYMVIHINHADEITPEVERALKDLQRAECVLLSQSVLLKGVNDNETVLEGLFRKLVALRVKPYYLHHPDYARGTSHFRLPIKTGQALIKRLLGRVSGLCQPTYMLDIPGGHGKVPLTPGYISSEKVEDYQGQKHTYPKG